MKTASLTNYPLNLTNWKLFEGDVRIFYFLHYENNFQDMVINEVDHDEAMNKENT